MKKGIILGLIIGIMLCLGIVILTGNADNIKNDLTNTILAKNSNNVINSISKETENINNTDSKNNNSVEENTSKVSNKTNTKTDSTKRINAGNYYLEYGKYENITYDIEQGGGTYILNEDGTFTSTNFQGTATGKYTVSLETYTNSDHTETNWLIKFKSSDNNVYANYDWIIDGNNEFHGIQDGGTNKYIEK